MTDPNITDDILQELDDTYLLQLRDLYADTGPETIHIYNYICSVIKWKTLQPNTKYFTILVPNNAMTTGTFVAINQYHCNELIISTLDESYDGLHNEIVETKRIDWSQPWKIFALPGKLYSNVIKALAKTSFEIGFNGICNIWLARKEKAANFKIVCPCDVYVGDLQPFHSKYINQFWPPRYIESEFYLQAMIEMNGGGGVFLTSNDQLVAWTVRDTLGLGALQTASNYRNKGYGSLVSSYLGKKIAEAGYNPLAVVGQGNTPTESMLKKLGFEVAGTVYMILNKQMKHLEESAKTG